MSAALPMLGFYRLNTRVNRSFLGMTLFGGIGLPLIIQAAFGQGLDPEARTRLLIGNVVFGLSMVVLRQTSFGLVVDRTFGYRDLVATTGLTRGAYLAAYGLHGASLGVLPLVVIAAGFALPGVAPPTSMAWLAPYLLTVVAFFALGAIFGGVAEGLPAVSLMANLAVLFTVAFCPVTYPLEHVPALLRPVVSLLPPSLAAELMADLWHGGPLADPRLLGLGVWSVALLALAWRVVPWTDRA